MNKIFLLLIAGTLFSQINVNPQKMNNFQDAFFMERKGEIEDAKIIYEKLIKKNPKDRQAYQRLKDIFKRTEELPKAIKLIEDWIVIHPNDLQAHIELGEILYLNNNKRQIKSGVSLKMLMGKIKVYIGCYYILIVVLV